MTREQAQVYVKLSREDIEKIDSGFAKHYDILCAYATGSEIQMEENDGKWIDIDNPHFCYSCNYRVNPGDAEQLTDVSKLGEERATKPWKPKNGEVFFYLTGYGAENSTEWDGDRFCYLLFDLGNCFRNSEEVESARERIRVALKGN